MRPAVERGEQNLNINNRLPIPMGYFFCHLKVGAMETRNVSKTGCEDRNQPPLVSPSQLQSAQNKFLAKKIPVGKKKIGETM